VTDYTRLVSFENLGHARYSPGSRVCDKCGCFDDAYKSLYPCGTDLLSGTITVTKVERGGRSVNEYSLDGVKPLFYRVAD
jgi:hypothetical protein